MKFKELKCKNCGANLEVEENAKMVTCQFCHTTFSVEDTYSESYDSTKAKLQAIDDHFKIKKISKISLIIGIALFIVAVVVIAKVFLTVFKEDKVGDSSFKRSVTEKKNDFDHSMDKAKDVIDQVVDHATVDSFNSTYNLYTGTQKGFFLRNCIDKVVTNNKTNSNHQITVKYNGIETKDSNQLVEMKQSMDDMSEFEVSLDYDQNGYIYMISIN